MKNHPLYVLLGGFECRDTPGVGAFYDFFGRLWDSDSDNLSPHVHPSKKEKVKKPEQKRAKAESVEKVAVDQLLKTLESAPFSINDHPYASLFKIYHREFLNVSVEKNSLTLPLFLLPETAPSWPLLPRNGSIMSAAVEKAESPTATVASFFTA